MNLKLLAAGLAIAPSTSFALCLTDNALPVVAPEQVLQQDWELHSDGSNILIHEFRLFDFDKDGKLDLLVVLRDESYDGAPIFSIKYYRGEPEGYCGLIVAENLAALNEDFVLQVTDEMEGFPSFTVQYTALNRANFTTSKVNESFKYLTENQMYSGR